MFKLINSFGKRNYSKDLKKFYKNVSIVKSNGGFEINLDRGKLRTPMGNIVKIENETLALAVAHEWENQHEFIKRQNMFLTGLVNANIDDPTGRPFNIIIDSILEMLDTDTLCYRIESPKELHDFQTKKWDPILQQVSDRYGVDIGVTSSLNAPYIPPETRKIFCQHLSSFNKPALIGLEHACEVLKSFSLSICAVDRFISVEEAVSLARLEVEYQTRVWGTVDWHHSLDVMEMRSRLAACLLFTHLHLHQSKIVHKQKIKLPV